VTPAQLPVFFEDAADTALEKDAFGFERDSLADDASRDRPMCVRHSACRCPGDTPSRAA
jgi:hypothetical protein